MKQGSGTAHTLSTKFQILLNHHITLPYGGKEFSFLFFLAGDWGGLQGFIIVGESDTILYNKHKLISSHKGIYYMPFRYITSISGLGKITQEVAGMYTVLSEGKRWEYSGSLSCSQPVRLEGYYYS